ncbi:hypothetical protein ACFLZ6_00140 [Nanoarchaeota archaeon]
MTIHKAIIKAVKTIHAQLREDEHLVYYENDFAVRFYHELMKDKATRNLGITTEWAVGDRKHLDMVIYDKSEIEPDGKCKGLDWIKVKHFKALLQFKVGWGRSDKDKIEVSKKDFKILKQNKNKADRLYYIFIDPCLKKFDISKLNASKDIALIYCNPILNKQPLEK